MKARVPSHWKYRSVLAALSCAALTTPGYCETALTARGDRLLQLPPPGTLPDPIRRFVLQAPLPNNPWNHLQRISLPGSPATPPLVHHDGTMVVGLTAPSGIAWIDRQGSPRVIARLQPTDGTPALEPAPGRDGQVFIATDNGTVSVVAPDGTIRHRVRLFLQPLRGLIARSDGTVAAVSSSTAFTEIALLSPEGIPRIQRSVPGQLLSIPTYWSGECLWLTVGTGPVCFDPSGAMHELSEGRGIGGVLPLDEHTLLTVNGSIAQITTTQGAVTHRLDVGAPVVQAWWLSTNRFAVLRSGSTAEVWVLSSDMTVQARIPVNGSRVQGVFSDPTGALLIATANGELTAYEPDGTRRWTVALQETITRPPVPLPGGGLVVPSETRTSGGMLFVLR